MSPLQGFVHAVLVLLAAGGGLKLMRPAATSRALRTAKVLPLRYRRVLPVLARLLGLVELVVAVAALVAPTPLALGVAAALFVGFNLFLRRLASIDATADCGCFGAALGESAAPAGRPHLVVNAAAAVALFTVAVAGWDPVGLTGSNLSVVVPYVGLVLVLAWLLAVGPGLWAELQAVPRRLVP